MTPLQASSAALARDLLQEEGLPHLHVLWAHLLGAGGSLLSLPTRAEWDLQMAGWD